MHNSRITSIYNKAQNFLKRQFTNAINAINWITTSTPKTLISRSYLIPIMYTYFGNLSNIDYHRIEIQILYATLLAYTNCFKQTKHGIYIGILCT